MGNSVCVTSRDLCASREFPSFQAPNTEHVTYEYDFLNNAAIRFYNGDEGAVTAEGFLFEPPRLPDGLDKSKPSRNPKWSTIKERGPAKDRGRLYISGRTFVQIPDAPSQPFPLRVFAVSTRGVLKEQALRTANFTHATERIASCLVFALTCTMDNSGLFLCPEISIILENGDEVVLVEDRLGPIIPPLLFFTDFSIADDGVNVQFDVILRGHPGSGVPSPDEKSIPMRTLRTCLQDYVSFNNHLEKTYISMGYSNVALYLEDAAVYLHNLVISEERKPQKVTREEKRLSSEGSFGHGAVVFEGQDVQTTVDAIDSSAVHPQLRHCSSNKAESAKNTDEGVVDVVNSEWYHVRYEENGKAEKSGFELMKGFPGEFWLSNKLPIDKKHVHFHCSSTLAQALTMCIGFRFSCPPHYLLLMDQPDGHRQLRLTHIPTNAFMMGVEIDPRSPALVRMFVENRNNILDDMPITEFSENEADRIIIHQEVYDSFDRLCYRVTLIRDGVQQSAALEVSVEQAEDLDTYRSYHGKIDEPSSRFPTSKTAGLHNLSPVNRIFIYTSIAYNAEEERQLLAEPENEEDIASLMLTPAISDVAPEDFYSVCGGSVYGGQSDRQSDCCHSDCEADIGSHTPGLIPKAPRVSNIVAWRRPLIESVRIFRDVREPPFTCSKKCS